MDSDRTGGGVVRLAGLGTAVPPYRLKQSDAKMQAAAMFAGAMPDLDRLMALYDNAGIDWRHVCAPLEWYATATGFAERNRMYLASAEALLVEAAELALERAGLVASDIDAVVTVSSTGIATPSLDARIGDRLGLRADVERTPLFGLGCAGGVLGMARAAALTRAAPGSKTLLVVVELCSLTLRPSDRSKANLVACALFADGAAAAVLTHDGAGPAITVTGEHRWPRSLDVMGWTVEDDGLGVLFSVKVPEIVSRGLRDALANLLARDGLTLAMIDRFVCHPGGARVVTALEEALPLTEAAITDARDVLRNYGNMSAATVMFVLEHSLADPGWRRGLMTAMGPGFCAGMVVLER